MWERVPPHLSSWDVIHFLPRRTPESPICPSIWSTVHPKCPCELISKQGRWLTSLDSQSGYFLNQRFRFNATSNELHFPLLQNFQRTLFSSTNLQITCQNCKSLKGWFSLPVWRQPAMYGCKGKTSPSIQRHQGAHEYLSPCSPFPALTENNFQQVWVHDLIFSPKIACS